MRKSLNDVNEQLREDQTKIKDKLLLLFLLFNFSL